MSIFGASITDKLVWNLLPTGLLGQWPPGTTVTLGDSSGRTATGYVWNSNPGIAGTFEVVTEPGLIYTSIEGAVVTTALQSYSVNILDFAKFNALFYFKFTYRHVTESYLVQFKKVTGDGEEIYFFIQNNGATLDAYYSVKDREGNYVLNAGLLILDYDTTYKFEVRVVGQNVSFYINDDLEDSGASALSAPFSSLGSLVAYSNSYYSDTSFEMTAMIIDQVTPPTSGWVSVDSGFDDLAITLFTRDDGKIIEQAGLTAEVITIADITEGSTLSGGEFFLLSSPRQEYYVWFTVDGAGVDPEPEGLLIDAIVVAILSTDTANGVAVKLAAAIDAKGSGLVFDVPAPAGTTIVITNLILGSSILEAEDDSTWWTFSSVRGTDLISEYNQLPLLECCGYTGALSALTLPSVQINTSASSGKADSVSATVDIEFPVFTITTKTGENFQVSLPKITLSSSSIAGAICIGNLTLSRLQLISGDQTVNYSTLARSLPMVTLDSVGLVASAGNLASDIPFLTLYAMADGTATPICYALNTEINAISEYLNWTIDSFGVFNNEVIAATPSGIFKHSGSTDNGTSIAASCQPFLTNLGTYKQKRIRSIFVDGKFDGDVTAMPIFDIDGKSSYSVECPHTLDNVQVTVHANYCDIGTNLGVKLTNTNGSYFEVNTITAIAIPLSLRAKTFSTIGRVKVSFPSLGLS